MIKLLCWPFVLIFKLIGLIINIVGKFAGGLIGLGLIVLGLFITFTIIGAPLGIPMVIFGFLIMIKAIF